jgi:WD40 repeat protein
MTEVFAFLGDTQQDAVTCPYKGLGSYTEADKEYFFARDSFRDLVAANLMASRLTVLYGSSGVGKSSLLQAGVIPLLRRTAEGAFSYLAVKDAVVVYCDSWRDDPLAQIGGALLRAVPNPAKVSDLMAKAPALSLELLQEVASRSGANIYLLLDQFEELSLSHTEANLEAFNSELGRIIRASGVPVSMLLGVRDDALAELDQLEPYVPDILDNKLRLEHLTPAEAKEAIEQPLVRYNAAVAADQHVDIESALVTELLAELVIGSVSVGERGDGVVDGSQSVEAPYLQLVMTRLWSAETEHGSHSLRLETLRQLGGAEQIVGTHLDAVLAAFNDEQRETASRVFRHLVTKSGRKISHDVESLADGSQVLTVARDGEVHLYDSATAKDLGLLSDRGSYAQAAWGTVERRPVVLTVDVRKPPQLWDAQRQTLVATYGTGPSRGAALSSDGRYVVSLEYVKESPSHRISVWDAASGRLLQRSEAVGHDVSMGGFAGTDSGQVVFFAIQKDAPRWQLMSWNWRKGSSALRTLNDGIQRPGTVVVSKDGRLVAAPLDKRVQVFNVDAGNLVGQTAAGLDWMSAPISFSPDGRLLATTNDEGRVLIWLSERVSNRPVAELIGHRGALADVRFDPRNDWRLTTAGYDGTARIWQLPERSILPSSGGSIRGAELSRNDQYLVTAAENGELRVYKTSPNADHAGQWSELGRASLSRYGGLTGASFSPDGLRVAVVGEFSRAPSVWAWNSSSSLEALSPWVSRIRTQPVISADGRRVAAGDLKGDVIVWDLESHKIIARLAGVGEGSLVGMLVAVPGSDWFATASTDGTVRLWDPDRPKAPQKSLGNAGGSPIAAVGVSNDGANLVSVSKNDEVKVWRLSDGEPIWGFQGAPSSHSGVAFSRDGSLVAIGGADGTIHVWHWADAHKLAALRRHGDSVNVVLFMPDGSLLTASESTVAVFRCTTCGSFDDLLKIARDRVTAQQR